MSWVQNLIRRLALRSGQQEKGGLLVEHEVRATRDRLVGTVAFAMEVRDSGLQVIEHSALVSMVAAVIAERMELSEAEQYTVRMAAQLHEVGMFAVPRELLWRPTPLTSAELERVRAQARVSAEVAGLAHPPRVAKLIEHQYDDHFRLAGRGALSEREVLLAGILRVADVFTAVTWPRPYQDPMPPQRRADLLTGGAGTRFHPLAVRSAVQLWAEA